MFFSTFHTQHQTTAMPRQTDQWAHEANIFLNSIRFGIFLSIIASSSPHPCTIYAKHSSDRKNIALRFCKKYPKVEIENDPNRSNNTPILSRKLRIPLLSKAIFYLKINSVNVKKIQPIVACSKYNYLTCSVKYIWWRHDVFR